MDILDTKYSRYMTRKTTNEEVYLISVVVYKSVTQLRIQIEMVDLSCLIYLSQIKVLAFHLLFAGKTGKNPLYVGRG